MAQLIEFRLFCQLPVEIRCAIWRHCLPGPRIHHLARPSPKGAAQSSCPPPSILFVCRESHSEALRYLKPLRLPSHSGPCVLTRSKIPCCVPALINPQIDTIYLPGRGQHTLGFDVWLQCQDLDRTVIRSLAVDVGWSWRWVTGADEKITIGEITHRLGHVEILHLVSQYSLFNPDIAYDYSSWGRLADNAEPGWSWLEPVDHRLFGDVSYEPFVHANMMDHLEKEKRSTEEASGVWEIPEVVVSIIKFERAEQPVREEIRVVEEHQRAKVLSELDVANRRGDIVSRSFWARTRRILLRIFRIKLLVLNRGGGGSR